MLSLSGIITVRRSEDKAKAGRWQLNGGEFRTGAYSLAIFRGSHPDETPLAELDAFTIMPNNAGALVTLDLTAEDIAAAQGPRRPEIDLLYYRLRHEGADVFEAVFAVYPAFNSIEAPRGIGARQGAPA